MSTQELITVDSDEILTPGVVIKPDVGIEDARNLAKHLYGIVAKDIAELVSYDDRNYHIKPDSTIMNPLIANQCPHGYILKIQNSLDSKKTVFADAQSQMMLFLDQQNVRCPRPIMNIYGQYFSLEKLPSASVHCVRLLEFVPGQVFQQVPKTSQLFFQVGEQAGRLNNALANFQHDAFKNHRSLWQLSSFPKLSQFIHVLEDTSKRDIVVQVLKHFDTNVVPKSNTFAKGVIHGDFNEQNILVTEETGAFRVSAVIDFGDCSYTCYVFELAIVLAYMLMQDGDLSVGGLVLAGYRSVRPVPEHEMQVLKVCVAARLCQSLVLGAYSHSLDPGNDYVLSTQTAGWDLLARLWAVPDDRLVQLWSETADDFLAQNTL